MLAPFAALVGLGLPSDDWSSGLIRENAAYEGGPCVRGIGDVDGDGVPDLALLDRGALTSRLVLLSGRDGALLSAPTIASHALGANAVIDGARDFDADGFPDLVVGDAGRAYVLSACDGALLAELEPPMANGAHIDRIAVAGGGDFDADGLPDVAVGQRTARGGTGHAWIYTHASNRPWIELSGPRTFGWSVGFLPDVDGDGASEVLIGAPLAEPDSRGRWGWVSIARGGSGAEMARALPGPACHVHEAVGVLGHRVEALGDVDGDGAADFVASGIDQLVAVHSGRTGQVVHFHEYRPHYMSAEGTSIAALGDVDGDGVPDYAIGANEMAEPIVAGNYSFFEHGLADVRSGKTGESLASLRDEGRGIDVAGIGDVDGDGAAELVVAYPASYFPADHPRGVAILRARELTPLWSVRMDELRAPGR